MKVVIEPASTTQSSIQNLSTAESDTTISDLATSSTSTLSTDTNFK